MCINYSGDSRSCLLTLYIEEAFSYAASGVCVCVFCCFCSFFALGRRKSKQICSELMRLQGVFRLLLVLCEPNDGLFSSNKCTLAKLSKFRRRAHTHTNTPVFDEATSRWARSGSNVLSQNMCVQTKIGANVVIKCAIPECSCCECVDFRYYFCSHFVSCLVSNSSELILIHFSSALRPGKHFSLPQIFRLYSWREPLLRWQNNSKKTDIFGKFA